MGAFANGWRPDILPGFEQASIHSITLVRPLRQSPRPRSLVLHVHGYNDYFFQDHLARAIVDAGHGFYAVDLARAGRSLKPGDTAHYMADIAEQGDGITLAAESLAAEHPGVPVVIHGHSTGALAATIWACQRPHRALAGLILDSPLFGMRLTRWQRVGMIALPLVAAVRPMAIVASTPSVYARHQHVTGGGRWHFDVAWKRPTGVPVRAAWLVAARRAHAMVARGLNVRVPVLVARSDSCGPDFADNPLLDRQDTVIDVADIVRLAPRIGEHVEQVVIPGGVHDLVLSQDEPRESYIRSILRWLDSVVP